HRVPARSTRGSHPRAHRPAARAVGIVVAPSEPFGTWTQPICPARAPAAIKHSLWEPRLPRLHSQAAPAAPADPIPRTRPPCPTFLYNAFSTTAGRPTPTWLTGTDRQLRQQGTNASQGIAHERPRQTTFRRLTPG